MNSLNVNISEHHIIVEYLRMHHAETKVSEVECYIHRYYRMHLKAISKRA